MTECCVSLRGICVLSCLLCLGLLLRIRLPAPALFTKPPPAELTPLILAWTQLFSRAFVADWDRCPVRCELTANKSDLANAAAVLFHIRDIGEATVLPERANSSAVFVAFNVESPPHSVSGAYGAPMGRLGTFFDWTMTYRADSSIHYPYGWFEEMGEDDREFKEADAKRLEEVLKSKRKPVAWMVSNCETPSKRREYVQELARHISVDESGNCANNSCPKSDWERCEADLSQNYKFYLAFENSVCQHYVTEKFWKRLHRHLVPIVLSRSVMKGILPPDFRLIAADDFESPKALAAHLLHLHENLTAYRSLFDWRRKYRVREMRFKDDITCRLCQALHQIPQHSSYLPSWFPFSGRIDFRQWFSSPACLDGYGLTLISQ